MFVSGCKLHFRRNYVIQRESISMLTRKWCHHFHPTRISLVIAFRMGLAISFSACVKEKVWYHSNCSNRGRGCYNTRLTSEGGCCIWYNEPQVRHWELIRWRHDVLLMTFTVVFVVSSRYWRASRCDDRRSRNWRQSRFERVRRKGRLRTEAQGCRWDDVTLVTPASDASVTHCY